MAIVEKSTITITRGKFQGINALADSKGVIAAAAMDQRGSLQKMIAKARGADATGDDLVQFKISVSKVLTRYASAILLDPEFGLPAVRARAKGSGVLLAYEKTGYDAATKGRLPDVLPNWSVRRLIEAGADAIKILLYYNPTEGGAINDVKHAFIERVGGECAAYDVPFFLECVTYDDDIRDPFELAKRKPDYVTGYMAEFTKPQYGVDVLKVEVPIDMAYVSGTRAFKGQQAYTREEAMRLFQDAASVVTKPFIYLSAGVTDEVFRETLELAAEAGTNFSGVLCGRATWQDGVPAYAKGGEAALDAWLEDRGVQNIMALNAVLAKGAKPWWTMYGGVGNIEVVPAVGMLGGGYASH
jgi:tagatose 1,6-diphosphate aldolase